MSNIEEDHEELGSLAQSSRGNDLGRTRGILITIGVLTLLVNGFMFMNSQNEVKQLGLGPQDVDRVLLFVRLIYGGAAGLGLFFIMAGIFVKKFPVPLTIASLILYIGATAGFAFLDPTSLMHGIIIKVIIVVALVKSVKTAWEYQKEMVSEAE
jgi:hypothetical protein